MAIGSSYGSKTASYRFRAENAHRFPTTSTGWFQYHKTKNYVAIVGGVKNGMKLGFKLGAGALAFCLFEETVDYARHDRRDFLSTVTAGLSFSGIYSLLGLFSIRFMEEPEADIRIGSATRRLHCRTYNETGPEAESRLWINARCA
jgi:hypothetical protein